MRTPNMTGTCILIVEDEPAIREMIAMALSRERYDVMEAADADAAINRITERSPERSNRSFGTTPAFSSSAT